MEFVLEIPDHATLNFEGKSDYALSDNEGEESENGFEEETKEFVVKTSKQNKNGFYALSNPSIQSRVNRHLGSGEVDRDKLFRALISNSAVAEHMIRVCQNRPFKNVL